MKIEILERCENHTGERPVWDPATETLYWIDVFGRKLFRKRLPNGTTEQWNLRANVGSMALTTSQGILLALQNAFFMFDPQTDNCDLVCFPDEGVAGNLRLNDGKVDNSGRFVCGGADFFRGSPIAGLYSLDGDLKSRKLDSDIVLTNGIAWSVDSRTLYYSDSFRRATYRCDYDPVTGTVGKRKLFAEFAPDEGMPDGAAIDNEGHLWIAMVYGRKLVRLDPQGNRDREIEFPVQGPTSLAFGGPKLDILFVTSKSRGKNGEPLDIEAGGGSVFAISGLGVKGMVEPRFQLSA